SLRRTAAGDDRPRSSPWHRPLGLDRMPEKRAPTHLARDEHGRPRRARRVPLVRRVRLTVARLLRTWHGRLVLVAGMVWLPLGIAFLHMGAEQGAPLGVSLGLVGFGALALLICGVGRYDDPSRDPRRPGVWGAWDWRGDAGIVSGVCLVVVGVAGALW